MARPSNVCAGPFGRLYDFYIERPWLSRAVGRVVWGIDTSPLYASMAAIGQLHDGATILDVPCGGGVALRALRPDQRVRYLAVDVDERMLARFQRRAHERSLTGIEAIRADMRDLPLADASADLCLSYSGLHMVPDPAAAIAEIARCLKPGGQLVGTTFLAEGTRRQRCLLGHGQRTGINGHCPETDELRTWLQDAGIAGVLIAPERGFAMFHGVKAA
jgi:ubiquinone/menaquinone biosynthesis C-methylase UbiE